MPDGNNFQLVKLFKGLLHDFTAALFFCKVNLLTLF